MTEFFLTQLVFFFFLSTDLKNTDLKGSRRVREFTQETRKGKNNQDIGW